MKKKLFLEPEVEVLNFLCNTILGPDSYTTGDDGEGDDLPNIG